MFFSCLLSIGPRDFMRPRVASLLKHIEHGQKVALPVVNIWNERTYEQTGTAVCLHQSALSQEEERSVEIPLRITVPRRNRPSPNCSEKMVIWWIVLVFEAQTRYNHTASIFNSTHWGCFSNRHTRDTPDVTYYYDILDFGGGVVFADILPLLS